MPGFQCAPGRPLPKSRILCEEREPVVVDIEVDQVNLGVQHNGQRATRIGGRIVADRERLDKISKLFIIDLQ